MPTAIIEWTMPMPSAPVTPHGEHDAGKRQQRIDDPADHTVNGAAEVSGAQADRQTDRKPDRDRHDARVQRDRRAVEQPAQDIAAEIIRAQQMVGRRPLQHRVVILVGRRIRRDEWREDGQQCEANQEPERDRSSDIPTKPMPHVCETRGSRNV